MKKFIPANPASFVPLHFPRLHVRELRLTAPKAVAQPSVLALPSPAEARGMAGILAFLLVLV